MNIYQFSNYNIEQLETYADNHWTSVSDLALLNYALRRKNTNRAYRLSGRVKRRIEELRDLTVRSHLAAEFREPGFRAWAHAPGELSELPKAVVVQGVSPLDETEFNEVLDAYAIDNLGNFSDDAEAMVIGQEEWLEEAVNHQLDDWAASPRRVYSQEMFLAFLLTRKEPLLCDHSLLRFFSSGHPALTYLLSIGFKWPTTEAPLGSGEMEAPDSPETGVLKEMGYTVGKNGKRDGERHRILQNAFKIERLPRVGGADHMATWGASSSETRLRKMAEALAAFARNAKRRRDASMMEAIEDWESDLTWLKNMYYGGRFSFQWPDTSP